MAENSAQTSHEPASVRYSRAFRPLSIWLSLSAVFLACDYHRKQALLTFVTFDVRVEGEAAASPFAYLATIGTRRVESGSVTPIGWHTLLVTAPDAEPFQKSLFVWYGENKAGRVDLHWKRGVLDLKVEPSARLIHLNGPHHRFSLTNSQGTTVSVPIGTYRVSATFEHLSEQEEVGIGNNETNLLVIKPNVGRVRVESEPVGSQFRMSSAGRYPVSIKGETPMELGELPAGAYTLRMWRGDYVKEMPFDLKGWETNRVSLAFEYGAVKVLSEPEGAAVRIAGKEVGRTPTTITELKPGPYRFRLEKAGYGPIEMSAEVIGTNTLTITTNLLNLRYSEAITSARRGAGGLSPDYREALTWADVALKEKPDDAEALALKAELVVALRVQEEREAEQKKQAELDARKLAASRAFEQATSIVRQAELFDTHRWEFRSSVETVRAALLRAFSKSSPGWTINQETRADFSSFLFYCKPKGILAMGKQCVVLVSEVGPGEVHVIAKFWDYVLSQKVTLSLFQGVTPESLIPIHVSNFPADQAAAIEARRRELAESLHRALQNELR